MRTRRRNGNWRGGRKISSLIMKENAYMRTRRRKEQEEDAEEK